jgi:hypothetical protein
MNIELSIKNLEIILKKYKKSKDYQLNQLSKETYCKCMLVVYLAKLYLINKEDTIEIIQSNRWLFEAGVFLARYFDNDFWEIHNCYGNIVDYLKEENVL